MYVHRLDICRVDHFVFEIQKEYKARQEINPHEILKFSHVYSVYGMIIMISGTCDVT